jgi:hypothetical protein
LDDLLGAWLYLDKRKSMKWSGREDLVLGRTMELLVVLIHMNQYKYGIVLILVFMF